jgi:hypothetical protein
MSKVKGTISKFGKGKFGFFLMLEEKDGFYFNTKYDSDQYGVGDTVGIEYLSKGETRGNVKKVKLLKDSGGTKGAQESAPRSGGGGGGGGYTDRSPSIVMQHSQEMAIAYVSLLIEQGAVSVAGKADAKRTQISAYVDEETDRFYAAAIDPKGPSTSEDSTPPKAEDADEEWDDESEEDDEWED